MGRHIIRHVVFFAVFSGYAIASLRAEDALTWPDCVNEAQKNHPGLISAAEKVKQVKKDYDIAISAVLPDITSEASGTRSKARSNKTGNSYNYGVTGEQLVFDGFNTTSDISNAFKTVKAEEYNYKVTSSNIRFSLREAFVNLMKAQELINISENIAERRGQNLKLVELRYEAGREHKGSLLTAEANLANAEFEALQARRSVSLAQRQLTKEMGRETKKPLKAEGGFAASKDYYNTQPNFEYLAAATPFLMELIAEKEAARYSVLSEVSDFFPQVYVNTSAGRSGTGLLPKDEEWSAGFSVSFPLFEGGSRFAEVAKSKSQLHQAEADERSGRDSVLFTLEKTWKDLQDSIAYVSVQNKFLEAAEERAKITSAQYENGLVGFDDWIIIEDNLVSAKKSHLNARANMLLTEAYWIQAIGGTLEYDKKQ